MSPTSFELDLQRFAEDLATRPTQRCSLSASEVATSTTDGVELPRAECCSHMLRVAHTWRATLHSSSQVLGVFQVGGVSDSSRGGLEVGERVFYTRAVTEQFSSFSSI